jgi:uncharacterized membrane protein
MAATRPRVSISRAQLEWLRAQAARWHAEGLIDEGTRSGILAGYEAASPQGRGLQALAGIGILICAVGVLLVIGYNWPELSPMVKVVLVVAAVSGAFVASALAYRADRPGRGEAFAFAGTLLYANGIWLVAQALNIQGHFPDAFFWAAAGALVCAWLVHSTWTGILGAALLLFWGFAEGVVTPGNNYLFLLAWPLAIWTARRLDAPVMLAVTAAAAVVWVATLDAGVTGGVLLPAAIVLAGCALHAAGGLEPRPRLVPSWQLPGLLATLIAFIPLMVFETHAGMLRQTGAAPTPIVVTVILLAAAALAAVPRARPPADWSVAAAALGTCVWAGLATLGLRSATAGVLLFSVATLTVGVGFVRTALTTGNAVQLSTGAVFIVVFLLVRWISVLGNLLLSGGLLLAAGAGLLLLARLWQGRDRVGDTVPGGAA